jgi:integrase
MGYCNKKTNRFGEERWTAMFLDRHGIARSAGTYDTEEEGDDAWKEAEKKVKAGKGDHLVRGRTTFRDYTEKTWLPHITVEVKTREVYTYQLYAHIMDFFGDKPMLDIYTTDIKEWLLGLKQQGVSAVTRKRLKQLLSSILGSAVDDEYIVANPCLLVKTDAVPKKPLTIISPAQYEVFHDALPDALSKLLVETAIETGMRWGELTELRADDWSSEHKAFTVQRAVVQVRPEFHPEGNRFFVKDYPKDGEYRVIKVADHLASKINAHIRTHGLEKASLLFWYQPQAVQHFKAPPAPQGKALGRTKPNRRGLTYAHGTLSAYTGGRCRCAHCRAAMAAYRRKRRSNGKDNPRTPRVWETDGHIPNRWFREQVIKPALKRAGIKVDIRMHLLRHAHASWLLNGGADLMVVKERLGHGSITTTERYLHTIDNADETALAALDKVRQQRRSLIPVEEPAHLAAQSKPSSNEEILAQMAVLQAELTRRLAGGAEGMVAT